MKKRADQFADFQKKVIDALNALNMNVERLCALSTSQQLLQECVSPSGDVRTAEECADIIGESFCAALCLSGDLEAKMRELAYQRSEFWVDSEEEEEDEYDEDEEVEEDDEDEEEDDDDFPFSEDTTGKPRLPVASF